MSKPINVGIVGLGTLGTSTLKTLCLNHDLIAKRSVDLQVGKICDRKIDHAKELAAKYGLPSEVITADYHEVTTSPDVDIVVEVVGGIDLPKAIISEALSHGKSVVTANKDLIAAHGKELYDLADANGADFMFEPAVAGAIPILKSLQNSMKANNIKQVMGIVNGTTNYILSEMTAKGVDFAPCLKKAQELGYAESDPTNDVGGFDAARKVAILSSIAFNSYTTIDDVYVEGITNITKHDIDYAKDLGYVIKLLGIAKIDDEDPEAIEARVHPVLVPKDHPLASINESYNAVYVEGDVLGTSMLYGKGAGPETASAIMGDVILEAENYVNGTRGVFGIRLFNHKRVKTIDEVSNKFFIRLMVKDEPKVLSQIAQIFGDQDVSMDSVIQKQVGESGLAELVVITHLVKEANIKSALSNLGRLNCVDSVVSMIRVI